MTKRFECDKGSRIIIDNETKLHYIMTLDWECSLVTGLLNRFAEENEQLKSRCDDYDTALKRLQDLTDKKLEENEQLKDKYNEQSVQYEGLEEQVERLLDFKDNVFNLINAKIKEYKKYDGYDTEKYYIGTGTLKELKKELEND